MASKKTCFFCLFLVFFLGLPRFAAQALEIEFAAGTDNLIFNPERKTPLGEQAPPEHFTANYSFHGYLGLKGDYSDKIGYFFSLERDSVLQNTLSGGITVDLEYINIELGPFAGLLNTSLQPLKAGIMGGIELSYPGIIFGSIKGLSSIGSQSDFPGDYIQSGAEVNLGFWLPNVIPRLSYSVKSFTRREDSVLLRDELTRYLFSAEVFSKNVNYTIRVDMGFESLKRSYQSGNSTVETDELNAVFLGFEGRVRIFAPLRLILGMEFPVFAWAQAPMKSPEKSQFLFKFYTGLSWTFFNTKAARP